MQRFQDLIYFQASHDKDVPLADLKRRKEASIDESSGEVYGIAATGVTIIFHQCDDIYRPDMKLCRYIATLTLRLPLRLPAGLQSRERARPGCIRSRIT